MRSNLNHLKTASPQEFLSRRVFLSSLGVLTLAPPLFGSEPASDAIPVTAINHVMIHVTDPELYFTDPDGIVVSSYTSVL